MPALLTKDEVRGIIPPLVTPFTADEELDLPAFRAEVQYQLSLNGVRGLTIGGSTGEGHALEADELGTLVKVAVEEARGRIPVIAGIITTTTRRAVRYAKAARESGAGAVMVTPPIYQIASPDGLVDYYSAIHRETGMPYIVYNVLPHAPVTPEVYLRLVEGKTGIIGTKESIGGSLETLTELLQTVGDRISVTWANDWLLWPGFAIGATGSISGAAAILPKHSIALWNATQKSDIETARRMHFHLTNVAKEISKHNWPAGVKLVVNLQGRKCGPCRRPFVSVPPEQEARIKAALKVALADEPTI